MDAGAVGHLDSTTGFGPWPQGERLVAALLAEQVGDHQRTGRRGGAQPAGQPPEPYER